MGRSQSGFRRRGPGAAAAALALALACCAQLSGAARDGGLLPQRTDNTLAARRTAGSEWQWQHDAVEEAAGLANSTAGLQLLVAAAAKRQQDQGEQPAVVVTIANEEGVTALLPLFVETLNRVAPTFAATAVVIAVSRPAFDTCRRHRLLCFHDVEADARNQQLAREPTDASLPRNKTPQFLQIGWDKLMRLQDALAFGVPILFADTDIVWLRDPRPLLEAGDADLQLTHDGWGPNIGVMFVRPTVCVHAFMAVWLARDDRPGARDQYEFPAAVKAAQAECPAFKVEHLDKQLFPNGCCCGDAFPAQPEEGRKWVLWHAACGGDLGSKRQHLADILRAAQGL